MKENLHDIDKLFKDAVEQHTDAPSPDVWNKIEHTLDRSNVVSINKKYQRLKRVAAILLLLLACAAIYEVVNYNNQKNKAPLAGTEQKPKSLTETTTVKNLPNKTNNIHDQTLHVNNDSSTGVNNKSGNELATKDGEHLNKDVNAQTPANNNNKASEADRRFHIKNSRSANTQFAGDSMAQTNDDKNNNKTITPLKDDNSLKAPSKVARNNKGRMISNISNGNAGIANEQDQNNDLPAMVKSPARYYEYIGPFPYGNQFDKLFRQQLHVKPVTLLPVSTVKPAVSNNNIVKTSPPKTRAAKSSLSRFSINPFYSPDLTFNTLHDDHPAPGGPGGGGRDDKHDIRKNEKYNYGYTWGMYIDYSVSKRLAVQSGLSLSTSSSTTQTRNIYAERDNTGSVRYRVNASCGYGYILPKSVTAPAVGDSIKALSAKNTLQYLQVPLTVKYTIPVGRLSIVPAAGIQLNLLAKGAIKTTTDNGAIKETQSVNTVEGLKKSYLSGILSAGIQYSVSKRIDLQLVPTGRIGLNSINSGATVKTFSNSLGIGAGLKIKL